MNTSSGRACSATNFSQTTLLLMVLHLDAWRLHVSLYFLGPMYFRLFFGVLIFLGGLSKSGGLLVTQSIPPPTLDTFLFYFFLKICCTVYSYLNKKYSPV